MKDILKLNDKYNKVFFNWVKEDIFICINELEVLIENFSIENQDHELDTAISQIHKVSGVFRIIEIYSLYNLTIHIKTLISNLKQQKDDHELIRFILQIINEFKTFVNNFYIHNQNITNQIINSITAIRKFLKLQDIEFPEYKDKKQENIYINSNIVPLSQEEINSILEKDFQSSIIKINQAIQLSILAITNQIDIQDNIQRLNKALLKILSFSDKAPLALLFQNLHTLLNSSNETNISANKQEFFTLLQEIGSEVQKLHINGANYFNRSPDNKYLEKIKSLQQKIQTNTNQIYNQIIPENNSLIDKNVSNTVFLNIKQILNILKKQLEQFVNSNRVDFKSLKNSKKNLIKVSETLKILNYISLKKILDNNIIKIDEILEKRETPSQQSLMSLAGSILYIEDIIIGTIKKQNINIKSKNSTKEIHNESYIDSIIQEIIINLEKFQEEIVSFIYSNWDKEAFLQYEKLLHAISGALFFLNMKELIKIPDTIQFFTKNKLLKNDESPTWNEIDCLADSISGFQYYLRNITTDNEGFVKNIYNTIIENLSKLNVEISIRSDFSGTNQHNNTITTTNKIIHNIEDISNTDAYINYTDTIKIKERIDNNKNIPQNHNDDNIDSYIDITSILVDNLNPKKLLPPENMDTDDELIEIFTEEAEEVLETINNLMPNWQNNLNNLETLKEIRRAFHTLKGSGRMVKALVIGELSWSIENLLNKVLDKTINISDEVYQVVEDVINQIPDLIQEFSNNNQSHKNEIDILSYRAEIITQGKSWKETVLNANLSNNINDKFNTDDNQNNKIDEKLIRVFIEESNENINKVNINLKSWKDSSNIEYLIELSRIFHTMQGSGEMVNASVISSLSWSIENLISRLIDKSINKSEETFKIIKDVNAILPTLLNDLILRNQIYREDVKNLIQRADNIEKNKIEEEIDSVSIDFSSNKNIRKDQKEAHFSSRKENNLINYIPNDKEDSEILNIYLNEIDEHLKSFHNFIEIAKENLPQYITNELQRTIHTMKGSSYMVHFNEVADICAPLEILLKELKLNNLEVGFTELQILENVYNKVVFYIDAFKKGDSTNIDSTNIIQQINDLINLIAPNITADEDLANIQKTHVSILLNSCMDTILDNDVLLKSAESIGQFDKIELENIIFNFNKLYETSKYFQLKPFESLSSKMIQIYKNHLEYNIPLITYIQKLNYIQEGLMNATDQLAAGLTISNYTEEQNLLDDILQEQIAQINAENEDFKKTTNSTKKNNDINQNNRTQNQNEFLDNNDDDEIFNQFLNTNNDEKPITSVTQILEDLEIKEQYLENKELSTRTDVNNSFQEITFDQNIEEIESRNIENEENDDIFKDFINSLELESNNIDDNIIESTINKTTNPIKENQQINNLESLINKKEPEIEILQTSKISSNNDKNQTGLNHTITSETSSFAINKDNEDNIDKDILEIFLEEAPDILEQANVSLDKWLENPNKNQNEIKLLQRHLHTIKGGARMVGIKSLGTLTHELETLYEKFVDGELIYDSILNNILQESHDTIANTLDALQNNKEKLPDVQSSTQKIITFLNKKQLKNLEQDDTDQDFAKISNNSNKNFTNTEKTFSNNDESLSRNNQITNDKIIDLTNKNDDLDYTKNFLFDIKENETMDIIDYDILEIFLEEAPDTLNEANKALDQFLKDRENIKAIDILNRHLHTLQAGAKMAGISSLGHLAYELETIYESFAANTIKFNPNLGKFLQLSHEKISEALKALSNRNQIPKLTMFIRTLEYYKQHGILPQKFFQKTIKENNSISLNSKIIDFNEAKNLKAITANDLPFVIATRQKLENVKKEQKNIQEQVRVSSDILNNLVDLAGETSIFRGRVEQQVLGLGSYISEMDMTIERALDQLRRLDTETQAQISSRMTEIEQSENEDFDPLEMDRHSQLQQLSRALFESASDLNDLKEGLLTGVRDTQTLLLQQSRINTELQENLMKTRLISFERQLPRIKRIIRQAAIELNKEIDFVIENAQGEMDRGVLDTLMAPLEHMLRNAVDHGIEDKDTRIKLGKPEKGTIRLNLSKDGSDIILTLSDDGSGVKIDKVRQKAIEKGILDPNVEISDKEVAQLILTAGLSTAEQITQISGRGVGMDVAVSGVQQLGGNIVVHSKPGQGTTFVIRIPFTVSINKSLMVEVGSDLYAIPLTIIDNILQIPNEKMQEYYEDENKRLKYLNNDYQVYYLGNFLNKNNTPKFIENQKSSLILVKSSNISAAIHVDNIMGSQEIVVKTLSGQFSNIRGVSGVTLLGDGRVVVILDLVTMVRVYEQIYFEQKLKGIEKPETQEIITKEEAKPLIVMITDDSVTVRKVTSRLLERNGMKVITAKDGLDAVSQLQEGVRPDIMLLDIEMPNMDGFEAATNIRHGTFYPELPIIMITSRSGDKHKNRAISIGINEYMSKPYQEEALLDNIYKLTGRDK